MESKCSECGKALGANAIEGLCPECLMKVGLGSQPGTVRQGTGDRFTPPKPEELAAHFPQLEILELIGRGGMGAVYKARQKQLGRIVALKILPPGVGHQPAFAERFTREARALAALNHPGIVTLYEFGQTDGLFFFLMEFVDGVNLRQLLQAGRVAPREALAIVPQICDALQYAHDQGIVHRDIKPENILLDRKGRVKVADFGLARLMAFEPESPAPGGKALSASVALTEAGKVMGTPQYMAPEQLGTPEEVDHRADIYSLGVVLYQMLTGELPGKRLEPPSRKVHLDVRLDEVILRALEKAPERRYQQASQLKTQLETLAAGGAPPVIGTQGLATRPTAPGANPRLSRTAVLGAIWAPLCFITGLMWVWHSAPIALPRGAPPPGPAWWQVFLMLTLLPLGVLAPFGTTILGWVAVAQIRHSAGRLYGLGLAVFDGLLFPLLLLDGAILVVVPLVVGSGLGTWLIQHGHEPGRKAVLLVLAAFALALCVVVDWLVCRTVWRAVTKPLSGFPPSPGRGAGQETPPQASSSPLASVAMWVAVLSGLLSILCFCSLPNSSGGLVWPALVTAAVGLLLGITTRQTRRGKLALVIGCANTVMWVVVLVLASVRPVTLSAPGAVELADANQPVTPQVARASGTELSATASENSESPEVLTKLLTDFPDGIWNKPLAHYARNRRPDAWFALLNFPPAEDSWVNPAGHASGRKDLHLPADTRGEEIAEKADTGDLYVPDLDHLVPVRGTKLAPLKTKPLPPDVRPADADQSTLLQVLDYKTRPEIAAAIEAYDAAHPDDKWVRLQPGGRYGALRPDGRLILITAFGADDDLSIQMIPVGKVGNGRPTRSPIAPAASQQTIAPYPAVTLTLAWDGSQVSYPDPVAFLARVRRLPEYQAWLKTKDDHTFTETNAAGYRFATHFIGMGINLDSGPQELVANAEIFRPDGSLLASTFLGVANPQHWDTMVYDSTGTNALTRVHWRRDSESAKVYIDRVFQHPGTPDERMWSANRFGVVYSDSLEHQLPEFKDTPYTPKAVVEAVPQEQSSGPPVPIPGATAANAEVSDHRLAASTSSAPQSASFGPVIERVLPDGIEKGGYEALDLLNGKFLSFPRDASEDGDWLPRWLETNRVDLIASRESEASKRWCLMCIKTKLSDFDTEGWARATPADCAAALRSATSLQAIEDHSMTEEMTRAGEVIYWLPPPTQLPRSFAFQTREGVQGLLQLTGFTENPPGVKIRYQLVQPGTVDVGTNNSRTAKAHTRTPMVTTAGEGTSILARDVALHFADPTAPAPTLPGRSCPSFDIDFQNQTLIAVTSLLIGQTDFLLGAIGGSGATHVDLQDEAGKKLMIESWSPGLDFEKHVVLPVDYNQRHYTCPLLLRLGRLKGEHYRGTYRFCAYLSGHVSLGGKDLLFELVNRDRRITFPSRPAEANPVDALGLDLNGDGKVDQSPDSGEVFGRDEIVTVGGRHYQLVQADAFELKVVFQEVAEPDYIRAQTALRQAYGLMAALQETLNQQDDLRLAQQLATQTLALFHTYNNLVRGTPVDLPQTNLFGLVELGQALKAGNWQQATNATESGPEFELPTKQLEVLAAIQRARSFGPVLERVLPFKWNGPYCLDFDTGKLNSPPDRLTVTSPGWDLWCEQSGADAIAELLKSGPVLRGQRCKFVKVDTARWDTVKPARVVKELIGNNLGGPAQLPNRQAVPATFLFETREATRGVLQITGLSDNPPGLKIRYKLVEGAPLLASTNAASTK